jgi:hypothetical protein
MVILTLVHLRPFYFLDFTEFIEILEWSWFIEAPYLDSFPVMSQISLCQSIWNWTVEFRLFQDEIVPLSVVFTGHVLFRTDWPFSAIRNSVLTQMDDGNQREKC